MPKNGGSFIPQAIRIIWRFLFPAVYFLLAAAATLHCYRNSMFDIDLLGYASNAALADTGDVVRAHRMVYREPLTPHLRGLDSNDLQAMVLRRRAADPYYSALYLPYFSIKPLYVLTLEAAHKLGASVIDASRAVSALSYFGVAVMVWLYTRSWLGLLVMVLPETMILGQANEPDGLSSFLLLFGLWLLFVKRRDIGLLALLTAIWVRPDNLLLCLLVVVVLMAEGRLNGKKAAVLFLLCFGSQILISHYAYDWRELYYHTFLGGDPGTVPQFGVRDYLHALANGGKSLLHSSVPLFVLLWLVCVSLAESGLRKVLEIAALFSLMRFLLFPSYEARYYALVFLTTAAAAVRLGTEMVSRNFSTKSTVS
jgi:hypothetical protein